LMRLVILEDNPADVRLFREALNFAKIDVEVNHIRDGISAIAMLRSKEGPWDPAPDIVFLDLNMPRLSGFEVLEILRGTPECDSVRIVVFTSSQSPADAERATRLKADRFVRKPTELREFFTVVGSTVRDMAI
jgi:two-component system, chemotaxis family, response regulator Rcp1